MKQVSLLNIQSFLTNEIVKLNGDLVYNDHIKVKNRIH